MKERRLLDDYYKWEYVHYENDEDDDGIFRIRIFIDGEWIIKTYEMTLSPEVPDSECCRVRINRKLYYFG